MKSTKSKELLDFIKYCDAFFNPTNRDKDSSNELFELKLTLIFEQFEKVPTVEDVETEYFENVKEYGRDTALAWVLGFWQNSMLSSTIKHLLFKDKRLVHIAWRLAVLKRELEKFIDRVKGVDTGIYKENEIEGIIRSLEKRIAQMPTNTPDVSTPQLPKELDIPEAKEIFTKAVEAGLMEVQGNGYNWLKSKALLAYFADKMSEYLKIGKGIYDGRKKHRGNHLRQCLVISKDYLEQSETINEMEHCQMVAT